MVFWQSSVTYWVTQTKFNMEEYHVTLSLLCLYGFFKELRPSEPYLTDYLTGPQYKNISQEDVYDQVYPVWPYSYFALLVPVFLLTDLLRYKLVIIFEIWAYWVTWALLIWAQGVAWMKLMQEWNSFYVDRG